MGQFRLEQSDHLDAGPGGAGDRDGGVFVGCVHLLDPPRRNLVSLGGLPVAGDHHARLVLQR
jgi:hypothetical protein